MMLCLKRSLLKQGCTARDGPQWTEWGRRRSCSMDRHHTFCTDRAVDPFVMNLGGANHWGAILGRTQCIKVSFTDLT